MPQSTIGQALSGKRNIPEKYIFELLCELAQYGLKIDGYMLSYDAPIQVLFGRKFLENIETIEVNGHLEYVLKESRTIWTSYFDLY